MHQLSARVFQRSAAAVESRFTAEHARLNKSFRCAKSFEVVRKKYHVLYVLCFASVLFDCVRLVLREVQSSLSRNGHAF